MRWAATLLLASCAGGDPLPPPGQGSCEEDPRALVQPPSATVLAGAASLQVEVADTPDERMRGLQYRRCGVKGLLLVAEEPGDSMPIWMCEVVMPLDLAFIRDGRVVHVAAAAPPCAPPCGGCATYGADVAVDAVLETPAGSFPLVEGDEVDIRRD